MDRSSVSVVILLIILIIWVAAYVMSYFWLVVPCLTYVGDAPWGFQPYYGCCANAVYVMYEPIHRLDRKLRPGVWEFDGDYGEPFLEAPNEDAAEGVDFAQRDGIWPAVK